MKLRASRRWVGWWMLGALVVGAAGGQEQRFVGGLEPAAAGVVAVRNDVHRAGAEVVTLRYFRIKKGSFEPFLEASVDGVWPYFEKLGARVIGMWRVVGTDGPPPVAAVDERDYEEVYLATRYASVDHWRASRETVRHGGNGPDWEKCQAALERRRGLTLSSHVLFLQGAMASNGPYFMPGLDERYRLMEE